MKRALITGITGQDGRHLAQFLTAHGYQVFGVVRGQAKHWPAGGEANAATLGPGSHWYQPGKAPHGDECVANECLLLIQMEGPYDFAVAGK